MSHAVARQNAAAAAANHKTLSSPADHRRILASLAVAQLTIIHLRDGEVVLYRRSRSLLYSIEIDRSKTQHNNPRARVRLYVYHTHK